MGDFERKALAFTIVLVVVLSSLLLYQNVARPGGETVTITVTKSGIVTVTVSTTPTKPGETVSKPVKSPEGSFGELSEELSLISEAFGKIHDIVLKTSSKEGFLAPLGGFRTVPVFEAIATQATIALTTVPTATPAPTTVKVVPQTYSTTNIQVLGVDEHDVVKTNGTHVVIASRYDSLIYVVRSYPPEEMREELTINVSRNVGEITGPIELKISYQNMSITVDKSYLKVELEGVYMYDGKIIAIARSQYPYSYLLTSSQNLVEEGLIEPYVLYITTWILIYDGSGGLVDYAWITGELVDSRLTGSKLIVVSRGEPIYWWIVKVGGNQMSIPTAPPAYTSWGKVPENATAVVGLPESYTTIMMYDIVSKERSAATVSGPSGNFIYVTPTGEVYVVSRSYWYRILPQLLEAVEKLENATSKEVEEFLKDVVEIEPSKYGETVVIRASTRDTVKVEAIEVLEGMVTNQFSIDVYNGVLRVALQRGWEGGFNLYTLNATTLEILGKLEGVAKGERVHGVRFLGPRMYIVTYRNIDPLFTIDLTDPENPKILGYREGPGFDEYLHPWNETVLIGLGFTDDRRLRISTYIVMEDGSVEKVSEIVLEDRWSPVFGIRGYHAFLLDKVHNLTMFPGEIRYYKVLEDGVEKWIGKGGIHVIRIDPESLKIGYVTILEHLTRSPEDLRPLYIEDYAYTVSSRTIKAYNILEGFRLVNSIEIGE